MINKFLKTTKEELIRLPFVPEGGLLPEGWSFSAFRKNRDVVFLVLTENLESEKPRRVQMIVDFSTPVPTATLEEIEWQK